MAQRLVPVLAFVIVVVLCGSVCIAQETPPAEEPGSVAEAPTPADEPQEASEPQAAPKEPQTSFTATEQFALDTPIDLDGQVLGVEVRTIEFSAKAVKKNVIAGAFSSGNDDLKSEIVIRLNLATTAETKQKLAIAVEFLGDDGEVIDRANAETGLKDNVKLFDFKTTTLKWVVPRVTNVRVTVEARK